MSAQAPIATPHEDLNAVLAKVGELARRSAGGKYIYRGEPKAYPAVSSSLYRWYEDKDIEVDAFDIEVVQRGILGQARGYTRYTGETDDLEILSQIQHNGGDTNLIDFTTDFLIALFFACDGEPGEPGRVILLSENGPDYQVVEPREPAHRVIAQKSVFVRPSKGFVEPNDIVDIPSNLKQSVLNYLRESHGIFAETIYNDLHGFIRHQGIHQSAYVEFYKGVTAGRKENYLQAIEHYNRAIEFNPQLVSAYNNRGAAYYSIGDYESAIRNYNSALELNPEYHTAYYNRGEAWLNTDEWDNAREDFATARNMGEDIVSSFRNEYENVADFERRNGITLPPDIAEMLSG